MRATLMAFLTAVMIVLPSMSASAVVPANEQPASVAPTDDAPAVVSSSPVVISVSAAEPLLEPGADEYRFLVRVAPEVGETVAAGQVRVSLTTDALTHPSELEAPDISMATASDVLALIDTPALEPGTTFETEFTLQADEFPLTIASAPGVYLTTGAWIEGGIASPQPGTPIVWNGNAIGSFLDLASIVPLIYPFGDEPPTTPNEVNEALQQMRAQQRILPAATEAGSLLAIDPRVIAYVRSLGASASDEARTLVEELTSGEHATVGLQYGDADPLITSLLSDEDPLEPTGLSFLTRYFMAATDEVETDFADPKDTLETESLTDGSVPPNFDALLEWETTLTNFAWPTPGSVNDAALATLVDAGYSQIVVSGASAEGSAKGTLGGALVYHSDATLEDASQDLLLSDTEFDTAQARAQLASITALQASLGTDEVPAQSLLAIERKLAGTVESLDPLIDELTALPWLRLIPTAELQLGTVQLTAEHDTAPAVDSFARAVEAEPRVTEYSRVLEEPQLLVDYQRDRLLQTLSVQGELDDNGQHQVAVDDRVTAHLAGNEALLDGVHIVDTEHTRLLGTTSNIPLQFRNTLPFEAKVVGMISTGTAALIVQDPWLDDTIIPAESTINEIVTVRSRVSSGEVELSVRLQDTHVGDDVDFTAFRVTLSGTTEVVALSTLSVIVVGLFAGGIWRSIAHRRQASRNEG